jgi:hypothetical protein
MFVLKKDIIDIFGFFSKQMEKGIKSPSTNHIEIDE